MRLIDADDLLDLFYVASAGQDEEFVKTVEMVVDETPTADVVEVKHGEWSIAIGYDINKKVKCSVCELMTYEPTAYCPHCGAKMDGGKDG